MTDILPQKTVRAEYIRSEDGGFMSADQIVADILANRLPPEVKGLALHSFAPPKSTEDAGMVRATGFDPDRYARVEFGRWIRNHYGLWDKANPHTMRRLDESQIRDGVDHHPNHPDNFSGAIIDQVVQAVQQEAQSA